MPGRKAPMLRGQPMKRGGNLKRSRLAPVSEKRRAEDPEYRAMKARVAARDRGCCQFSVHAERALSTDLWGSVPRACHGENHPHHIWPTGELGPRCLDDNVVTLCALHHAFVHDKRDIGTALGLMARGPHWWVCEECSAPFGHYGECRRCGNRTRIPAPPDWKEPQ